MVIRVFTGTHVNGPGRPGAFRTTGGRVLSAGQIGTKTTGASFVNAKGNLVATVVSAELESLFSRKNETANLDAVRAQHAEVIQHFDATRHNSIHITNNTPHIARLNDGWSAQTDPGFFERSVYEAKKAVIGAWQLRSLP